MAKIAFTKLGLMKQNPIEYLTYNGQNIEIKQYLPLEEKLNLIQYIISSSLEEDGKYFNSYKLEVYFKLGLLFYYTNISFTEKQKATENIPKLYDLFCMNDALDIILSMIPQTEKDELYNKLSEQTMTVINYHNSVLGILDSVSQGYSDLDLDIQDMAKTLSDGSNLELLTQIAPLLGLK